MTWRALVPAAALACAACGPTRAPPPSLLFDGLPVSGRIANARRAGFDDCFNIDAIHVRCRKRDVTIAGSGPYEGAVDLEGSDGEGGFDQLTLWHARDNYAVYDIADAFQRAGWRSCYTGNDRWGDQMIFTRPGHRVRVSMDMSYYAKRRLRIIPDWNRRERSCTPDAAAAAGPLTRP